MDQRIALYYPHTNITDEAVLKRALLLWDNLELIVPHEGYRFSTGTGRAVAESMELFGVKRVPTKKEQNKVHTAIEALTAREQPSLHPIEGQDFYEVYPEKFLPDTWRLLEARNLRRAEMQNADHVVSQNTGLVIMAMLAEVLAGKSRALYTDRTSAYQTLWATLGAAEDSSALPSADPLEHIIPLAFCNLNLDDVSLVKVLALRKSEEGANGASLRALRHKLKDDVASRARKLATLAADLDANPKDIEEFIRQSESDLNDDARSLRQELRATAAQVIFSKDVLLPVVCAAASIAGWMAQPILAGASALVGIPSLIAAGTLPSVRSKYLQQRLDIQKKHPTAYALHLRHQSI